MMRLPRAALRLLLLLSVGGLAFPAAAFDPANPNAGYGYRIASLQNGLCWTVHDGQFENGVEILQCVCHEGDSQLWTFSPTGPEDRRYYAIRSAANPQYCVVRDPSGSLELTICDPAQPLRREARFKPVLTMGVTNSLEQIARPDGGDCATVPNDSFENGQQLQVQACDSQVHQAWVLLPWRGFQNDEEVAQTEGRACTPP